MNNQTTLIIQALESAEKSLALAKKLLGGKDASGPGIVGAFDGEFMVTEKGQRHQVPPNYASKSRLVVGDTLRMIGSGEKALFKQIEKKERVKVSGVLTKKDGRWAVVAEEGSFFVLPVSVKFFKGEIGDEVEVIIPKDYKKTKPKWAALEGVSKEGTPPAPKPPTAPKQPEKPKKPEIPQTPSPPAVRLKTPKKPATAETLKKTEAQKKESLSQPKTPKIPKTSKTPKSLKGPKLQGEIKVEEELR
ncbi:MAG: hypothetical protein FJ044_02185 [Candidatus Cloacimonetes bacterium]|nr:hypothetical protein [Candidatus Cloacimonadota bacterium]